MSILSSLSLITAFFAGMVALFAPCCITFLLPSYLANIFREKEKILISTLIFGLGIAAILVPTAVGIKAIGQLFIQFHTQTYVIGGAFMILLGLMEITGKKITLPMLNLTLDLNKKHDPLSIFTLGIFSGLTSSCCTPVLAGVLTLSFLSPNFLWAVLAGFSYVAGMVFPLVVMALLLEKINLGKISLWRQKTLNLFGKPVVLSDFMAGILFITIGLLFSALALAGKIAMGEEQPLEKLLSFNILSLVKFLNSLPFSQILFLILLVAVIIYLIKRGNK